MKSFALSTLLIVLAAVSLAQGRRRSSSGSRRNGGFRNFFNMDLQWFEVDAGSNEDACLDVPDVLDSDGDVETVDGGTDDAEVVDPVARDENGGETSGRLRGFTSLNTVTVCENASFIVYPSSVSIVLNSP